MRAQLAFPAAAFAAALVVIAAAPHARAQEPPFTATTLAISAEGEAAAVPDVAVLSLGVTARGATAAEASARMRAQMGAAVAAVKQAGVAERDVQTSGLNLSARYDDGPNQPRRLSGYEASNQASVTVRDVRRTGAVLDAALAAGADTVNGVSFDLSDPAPAQDAARRAAMKALGDKARLLAEAAGLHVKRLVSLTEGGGEPPVVFRRFAMAAEARAPTPVQPGTLKVRASVSAVYELER